MKKAYKRNILLDYIHTFIRNLNFTHGIWMVYLAVYKDFSLLDLGIFEGIFHVTSITMEIPTGMVGDLVGRKFSRVLGVFSFLIYISLILFSNQFWLIALGFFFCGLSYTFESGSGDALIYDSLIELGEQDKYMKVQGIKEILYQLSTSIALFIGGYIAVEHYNLNFQIMFLVFVVSLIPILMMREISLNSHRKRKNFKTLVYEHFINSTKTVFGNKKLLFLIIIGALLAAPVTSLFFYLQNHLTNIGYDISEIGIILGLHSVAGAAGGYLAHIIERKFKEKLILYIVPVFIVTLLWLVLFDRIIFIPFILLGFFDSIFFVVLNDYMNKLISSEIRATVLSFGSLAFSIIMILVFPLLGLIAELSTLRVSFITLASIVTISYFILVFVLKNTKVLE